MLATRDHIASLVYQALIEAKAGRLTIGSSDFPSMASMSYRAADVFMAEMKRQQHEAQPQSGG